MKKKTPLVSILMPCYNSEKYVLEAITSIKEQTYINWELLICDDKSTDDSLSILKKLESEKITVFQNHKNQGYLKTCNFLFTKCKGEFITFQDSDDYSAPSRIENLITEFTKNNNLGACGTQFNFMTDNGDLLPQHSPKHPLRHAQIIGSFSISPPFCGASVMVKKEVLEIVGTYNEYWDRIGAEDHYWLYLIAEKFEVANIDQIQYYYRHNPDSVTRNKSTPRKIHCHDFLMHFLNQRISTRTDDLESNNLQLITKMEEIHIAPYNKDSTYIYTRLIDWAYTENNYRSVFKHIFSAIKKKPFSIYWHKTLFHYLRKIYM